MHVLALLSIGLLALRCVDTLAPLFMGLLFSFFDLLIIGVLVARPAAPPAARRSPPRSRLLLDLLLIPLLLLPFISLLLFLLFILYFLIGDGSRGGRS